jgi:hypothetical protein
LSTPFSRSLLPAVTLDQLAAEPARATALSATARATLLAQAFAVVGALAAPSLPDSRAPIEDRILDVPEVAHRMKVSQDYVYRHAAEWPFTIRRGRKLGFSQVGLLEYLRRIQEKVLASR